VGEEKCFLKMNLSGTFFQCFGKKAKDVPFLSPDIKIWFMWGNIHTNGPPYTPFFQR
jgi:hypothetical protein